MRRAPGRRPAPVTLGQTASTRCSIASTACLRARRCRRTSERPRVQVQQHAAEALLGRVELEPSSRVGARVLIAPVPRARAKQRLVVGEVDGLRNAGDGVLRVLGTFSSSTVVSTFERPFEPGGPQVLVIGSPVPMAAWLEEGVPA